MLYAELNENLEIIGERVYDPPLTNKELDKTKLSDGGPTLRPLTFVETPFNADTHKDMGFMFNVTRNSVTKTRVVEPLSEKEVADRKREKGLEGRKAVIPVREETLELLTRVIDGMLETLVMLEDPNDPRTELKVSKEDQAEIKKLVSVFKQFPLK